MSLKDWTSEWRAAPYKTLEKVEWPEGAKCAVTLSFDFDSNTLMYYYPRERRSITETTGFEFGARVGLPRILNLLGKYDIKTTFFTPGMTAEIYPEEVKEIAERGHEVGCHGYKHEAPNSFKTREEEKKVLEKSKKIIKELTGQEPKGWRKPGGDFSPHTLDLLHEAGFIYIATGKADDIPFRWMFDEGRKSIISIPLTWEFADSLYMSFGPRQGGTLGAPSVAFEVWSSEFNAMYRLGRFFNVAFHPFVTGRGYCLSTFEKLIQHIRRYSNIWFARYFDIAKWWNKKRYP